MEGFRDTGMVAGYHRHPAQCLSVIAPYEFWQDAEPQEATEAGADSVTMPRAFLNSWYFKPVIAVALIYACTSISADLGFFDYVGSPCDHSQYTEQHECSGISVIAFWMHWLGRYVTDTANSGVIQAISGTASAFFAGVLLYVSYRQGKLIRAANATAEVSAQAAKLSANISKDMMERTQRAFISVSSVKHTTEHTTVSRQHSPVELVGDGIQLDIKWANKGNTPSKNAVIEITTKFNDGPLNDGFPFNEHFGGKKWEVDIAPNTKRLIGGAFIAKDSIERLHNSPKQRLYIFGKATYYDVFDSTERHFTTFCMRVSVGNYSRAKGYAVRLIRHNEYNQTT